MKIPKNPYQSADKLSKRLELAIRAEFHNVAVYPFDELNRAAVQRRVKAMYRRLKDKNLAMFILIAEEVYETLLGEKLGKKQAEKIVNAKLREYNSVTEYVYEKEADRKRDRASEAARAADTRSQLREVLNRAQRLWVAQMKQYADDIVDATMLKAYRDAGIKRVRWQTQPDERTCKHCAELHNREFPIDDIPEKPHRGCRCYLLPVE
jgi:SPP1 gp7 family putative phage head morphogenesis protein